MAQTIRAPPITKSLWRSRTRPSAEPEPDANPADASLNRTLLFWVGLVVTVLILGSFLADRSIAQARIHALEVRVTAHQWWWRVQYCDPATGSCVETANEHHLPVGRTTRVTLESADVVHSFWVPNVAQKLDVIPGLRNVVDLTPTHTGWPMCRVLRRAARAHGL